MYYVYILECDDRSLYTGITNDVERRLSQHKNGTGGHYTRSRKVLGIVYTEACPDRPAALRREASIKKWPREKKLRLIAEGATQARP
jgi:predicted GIY-YIG superfamily endonuclease